MNLLHRSVTAPAVREIADGESLDSFIDLSWIVNRSDPAWIPPLRMSVTGALNRRKHPFHRHAEVAYFLATRNARPVGRIAAIVNRRHNEFHGDSTGFFGLFECEADPGTAAALFEAAAAWLRARGCDSMRGPYNLSSNDEISCPGVLIHGFARPPVFMMSHNPRYYGEMIEAAGLNPVMDLVAFWFNDPAAIPSRGVAIMDRLLERRNATIRRMSLRRFREDVDAIKRVYNAAWSRNWGFVPMTDEEFDHLAREFRPIVDPDLCLIAEVEGEPIGFSLALPNLNEAIQHIPNGRLLPFGIFKFLWYRRRIQSMRVLTLGFTPQYQHAGLGPALYVRTFQTGVSKGFVRGEGSWILDENHEMVRALERMGADPYKRYRLYERAL